MTRARRHLFSLMIDFRVRLDLYSSMRDLVLWEISCSTFVKRYRRRDHPSLTFRCHMSWSISLYENNQRWISQAWTIIVFPTHSVERLERYCWEVARLLLRFARHSLKVRRWLSVLSLTIDEYVSLHPSITWLMYRWRFIYYLFIINNGSGKGMNTDETLFEMSVQFGEKIIFVRHWIDVFCVKFFRSTRRLIRQTERRTNGMKGVISIKCFECLTVTTLVHLDRLLQTVDVDNDLMRLLSAWQSVEDRIPCVSRRSKRRR